MFLIHNKIKGDCVVTEGNTVHKDAIKLTHMTFSCGRNMPLEVGSSMRRAWGGRIIKQICIHKTSCISTPSIIEHSLFGESTDCKILMLQNNKVYMVYNLTDSQIAQYDVIANGDVPHETITISYTKIMVSYLPVTGTPMRVTYDLINNSRG